MIKSALLLLVILLSISSALDCIVSGPRQTRSEAEAYCDKIGCETKRIKKAKDDKFIAKCDCNESPNYPTKEESLAFCETVGCTTVGAAGLGGACQRFIDPNTGEEKTECGDPYYWGICAAPCTAAGTGPAQVDTAAGTKYCEDKSCFLESMHCNYGSLFIDENGEQQFNKNPTPCTPVCADQPPAGGPVMTAVAAHGVPSVGIKDNEGFNEEFIKDFYEMKNNMYINDIVLIVCFTVIAFVVGFSMLCVYHKMMQNGVNKVNKVKYQFVDQEEEAQQINE